MHETADPQDTARFKEWLIAKETVIRRNRNLLQYAAGLAALLGISGATSGVFAMAHSLSGDNGRSLGWILYGPLLAAALLAVILSALIIQSLRGRRHAEHEADERLRQLPADFLFGRERADVVNP